MAEFLTNNRGERQLIGHGAFVEKYFQESFILASVLFVLYRGALVV